MSTEYTPTMGRVRDMYSWAYAWRMIDDGDETDLSGVRESQRAEFDRALAAHDRETAAAALEAFTREIREMLAAWEDAGVGLPEWLRGAYSVLRRADEHAATIRGEGHE